jgi:threonine/homoserine/homoserine lactone efflux protein
MYLEGLIFLSMNHIIGLLSPGPCMAMVVKNSLYSRENGMMTVVGATLGSFTIKTISVLGLALILSQSPVLFDVFKICGGGYLIYLGGYSFVQAYKDYQNPPHLCAQTHSALTGKPFLSGYLMSLSNPMSSVRFLAIFSSAISAEMSLPLQLSYLIFLAIISFVYLTVISLFFSTSLIQEKMQRYRYILSSFFGITMVYWGSLVLMKTLN